MSPKVKWPDQTDDGIASSQVSGRGPTAGLGIAKLNGMESLAQNSHWMHQSAGMGNRNSKLELMGLGTPRYQMLWLTEGLLVRC